MKRKSASRLLAFLWLLSIGALVAGQAGDSILERFPRSATDALGDSLSKLFDAIDQFRPGKKPATPVAPNPAAVTELPNKPEPEFVPKYKTLDDNPAGEASSTMIVLHGLDSSPEQLKILGRIGRSKMPNTRIIFARAPKVYVTYLDKEATSWFDITKRAPGYENSTELRAAAAGVARLVALESDRFNVPSEKVVVLGMSQGGAVALTFYLAEEIPIGGVIVLSSWLPLPNLWPGIRSELPSSNENTPLFMGHGENDETISVQEATRSKEIIQSLGRPVRYKIYPGGSHTLFEQIGSVVSDVFDEFRKMVV